MKNQTKNPNADPKLRTSIQDLTFFNIRKKGSNLLDLPRKDLKVLELMMKATAHRAKTIFDETTALILRQNRKGATVNANE